MKINLTTVKIIIIIPVIMLINDIDTATIKEISYKNKICEMKSLKDYFLLISPGYRYFVIRNQINRYISNNL